MSSEKPSSELKEFVETLSKDELREMFKQVMRDSGYTQFINEKGEVEKL